MNNSPLNDLKTKLSKKLLSNFSEQINQLFEESFQEYYNLTEKKVNAYQFVESSLDRKLLNYLYNGKADLGSVTSYLKKRLYKDFNIVISGSNLVNENFTTIWEDFRNDLIEKNINLRGTASFGTIMKKRWSARIILLLSHLEKTGQKELVDDYLYPFYKNISQVKKRLEEIGALFEQKEHPLEKQDQDGVYDIAFAQMLEKIKKPNFQLKKNLEALLVHILGCRINDKFRELPTNKKEVENFSSNDEMLAESYLLELNSDLNAFQEVANLVNSYDSMLDANIILSMADEECAKLIYNYMFEHKTFKDIGILMGKSKQSVNKKYNNCINKLRTHFQLKKVTNE